MVSTMSERPSHRNMSDQRRSAAANSESSASAAPIAVSTWTPKAVARASGGAERPGTSGAGSWTDMGRVLPWAFGQYRRGGRSEIGHALPRHLTAKQLGRSQRHMMEGASGL